MAYKNLPYQMTPNWYSAIFMILAYGSMRLAVILTQKRCQKP